MPWPKGKKRPGHRAPPLIKPNGERVGRKKGTPNHVTTNLRTAIEESFHHAGGVKWLVTLSKTSPTAYASLLGRVIPQQHIVGVAMPSEAELDAMTPLDMLKWTMRACMQSAVLDPSKLMLMVDAANKAAQYEHAKLASIEYRGSLSLDDLTVAQLGQLADALASRRTIEGSATEIMGDEEPGSDPPAVRGEPL